MRKNKTWLIDLFNTELVMQKQPMTQIQNDEFWTSDTEAYLNFGVSTPEFIIDTAKINLYNKNDGTLVQRDMTIENNEAQYELPQEIIAHFGKWNAQVVFISGTERYTSPMVDFEVKRTLGDGAPEKLGIIRDWLVFESDAKELIATVEANELIRESAESERVANEEARELAEDERENAEEQRKTDHANRSAELAGKANKKQEEWVTPTLLNGATGDVQFRKNDVGRVEFRGRMIMPTSASAFILPSNYRPREAIIISLFELPIGETSRRMSITTAGSFFIYGSSVLEMSLGQLSFPAAQEG